MSHKFILRMLLSVTAFLMFSTLASAAPANTGQTKGTFVKPSQPTDESDWKPHVGAVLGMTNPEGNFDSAVQYGVDIGFQPYIPFGAGIEISTGVSDRTNVGVREDLRRTLALARGTYNLGGTLPVIRYSYVGGAIGPVIDSNSPYNGVHLGLAPLIGFDIPLRDVTQKSLSLGMNAKYIFVNDAAPDTFALNGIVKYWF